MTVVTIHVSSLITTYTISSPIMTTKSNVPHDRVSDTVGKDTVRKREEHLGSSKVPLQEMWVEFQKFMAFQHTSG